MVIILTEESKLVKRLIELRLKQGVSARDMSLSLGQSESYINKIENNKSLPSITVLFEIMRYFKITPLEFFDYSNDPKQTPSLPARNVWPSIYRLWRDSLSDRLL